METTRTGTGGSAPEFPLFSIIISLEHIDSTMVLQTEQIMIQNYLVCGRQVLRNLHMVFWLMMAQRLCFVFLLIYPQINLFSM